MTGGRSIRVGPPRPALYTSDLRLLPALAALALATLLSPAARAEPPPCEPAGALLVDGLSVPAADLARVAELAGAVEPSSRLVRRGGARA
jgi:hypothetical protein